MKKIKMIISLALTMIITLAMALPTMAADSAGDKKIIIEASKTVDITEQSRFVAYRVLNAQLVDDADDRLGEQVDYEVPAEMEEFYRNYEADGKKFFGGLSESAKDYDYQIAVKIAELQKNSEALFDFSKAALAAAKGSGVNGYTGEIEGISEENAKPYYVISGLPAGYYVVENVLNEGYDSATSNPISALITLTTTDEAEAKLKADKPMLEKKIDGSNDTDPGTDEEVDFNNVSIGDDVPYVLKSKVPDMTGYTRYKFVVTDVLSKGLSFNEGSVEITIGETKLDSSAYDVNADKNEETGETTVKIVLKNFYDNYKNNAGQPITIRYSAKVNEDAVIGTAGNPNRASLAYSNDPNKKTDGGSDDFKDGDPQGVTPDDSTRTYVTGIQLTKVAEDEKTPLSGAQFQITGTRLNQVLVTGYEFVEDTSGAEPHHGTEYYWGLKDGSYTQSDPAEGANGNEDNYVKDANGNLVVYKKQTYTRVLATETVDPKASAETEVKATAEVDENGVLTFEGLGAGDYTITELTSPDGKQLPDEKKESYQVHINWTAPAADSTATECKWSAKVWKTVDGEENASEMNMNDSGIFEFTVVNTPGSKLPGTGGMGTTIFYVIGGILVVGAGILLVARKRKDN